MLAPSVSVADRHREPVPRSVRAQRQDTIATSPVRGPWVPTLQPMLLPDTAGRTASGRLTVGGCDLVDLAERFGTPLYVYDEATLRGRLRGYRDALREWPGGGDVLYSAKAYLGFAMVRLLIEEDCGIDVVSGGELALALRAGMDPARIGFPGNNKDAAEVDAA